MDKNTEEEQRYHVLLPRRDKDDDSFNYLAKDNYHDRLWTEDSRTDGLIWDKRSSFTEKKIRELDKGDVLFKHYAVKLEEMIRGDGRIVLTILKGFTVILVLSLLALLIITVFSDKVLVGLFIILLVLVLSYAIGLVVEDIFD